jgi:hypothetical protein
MDKEKVREEIALLFKAACQEGEITKCGKL